MSEFLKYRHLVQNIVSFAFALPCAVIVYNGEEIPRGKFKNITLIHATNPNHRRVYRFYSNSHNDNGGVKVRFEEQGLLGWRKKREWEQKIKVGHAPFLLKDRSQARAVKR